MTTHRTMVRRILQAYGQASPATLEAGAQWYPLAGAVVDDIARAGGVTREHAAAVVAHLSPRTPWGRNVTGAMALVTTGTAHGHMRANVARALDALNTDSPLSTLKGPKTRRFAANMLGDDTVVTVDVWAARVALGSDVDTDRELKRAGTYTAVERAYQAAARTLSVEPSTMQAVCWIVARNGRAT